MLWTLLLIPYLFAGYHLAKDMDEWGVIRKTLAIAFWLPLVVFILAVLKFSR